MDDTKIIYHIDDEETPYLVKLSVVPSDVTLGDFKNALNRPNYKFFFKSVDADFGVVKEEITEDDAKLPCFNGKVISWLVSADSSTKSDNHSNGTGENHFPSQSKTPSNLNKVCENVHGVLKGVEVQNEQEHAIGTTGHVLEECDTCADTDSVYSGDRVPPLKNFHNYKHGSRLAKLGQRIQNYETTSSMMSSDLESTSFFDSEDESSRFSTATGTTMSSAKYAKHRRQRRHRRILPVRRTSEDATSFSSVTDSTMSLNIITVTLNMDSVNFLGISIVGQSNKAGDGGIYVGSIMRGGAVAQDGRIEPGDMILEVNRISFEDMSNDEAVRVLREEVQKPGPITLVVAKCWDPSPKNYFTIPRQEPVRPIDPRAWVLHTNAMTGNNNNVNQVGLDGVVNSAANGQFPGSGSPVTGVQLMSGHFLGIGPGSGLSMPPLPPGMPQLLPPSLAALGSLPSSSNMTSKSLPEVGDCMDNLNDGRGGYRSGGPGSSGGGVVNSGGAGSAKTAGSRSGGETTVDHKTGQSLLSSSGNNGKSSTSLTVASDMASVVHDMLLPDSGLEIHDRTWLKITIPNAFIGSDLVDWLFTHVDGFADRRDARRYASNLLRYGYIRHTVNKNTFSEQCYYTFGDLATTLSHLNFDELDSVSEIGANSHNNPNPQQQQLIYPYLQPQLPDLIGAGSSCAPSSANNNNNNNGCNNNNNTSGNNNNSTGIGNLPNDTNSTATVTGATVANGTQHSTTGPHYPYPPMLFHHHHHHPVQSNMMIQPAQSAHNSSNMTHCTVVDPNTNIMPNGVRNITSMTNNPFSQQPVDLSGALPVSTVMYSNQSGMDGGVYPGHILIQGQPHQMPMQTQRITQSSKQQQKGNHSSSSSPTRSSASSSSSSSTGSSGARLVQQQHSTTANQSSVAQTANNIESSQLKLQNATGHRHVNPSSVHSLSGTSSASSVSRQNGTGASATGSGSGSVATTSIGGGRRHFHHSKRYSSTTVTTNNNKPTRTELSTQQQAGINTNDPICNTVLNVITNNPIKTEPLNNNALSATGVSSIDDSTAAATTTNNNNSNEQKLHKTNLCNPGHK